MNSQQVNLKDSLISQEPYELEPQRQKSVKDRQYQGQEPLNVIGGSNVYKKIFFTWVSKILANGHRGNVEVNKMPNLRLTETTQSNHNKLYRNLKEAQKKKSDGWTLIKVIGKTFKKEFVILTILLFVTVGFAMYAPFLTSQVIDYINHKEQRPISDGVLLFLAITFSLLIRNLAQAHVFYNFTLIGFDLNNALSMMIFTKSLRYPSLSEKKFGVSQIINYSQVDAERMTNMGYQLAALLFAPLQISIGIYLMYYFIGISFLAGLGAMIAAMICAFFIAKGSIKYNDQIMKMKDERMKVTQEMLDIIRFIKITAIQKYFFKKLDGKREKEINFYLKKGFLDVLSIFSYWMSTPLILAATFATYIYTGNEMNSTVAFTTIMIFTILQTPIRMLPTSVSQLLQMFTSIQRIEKYLFAKQLETQHIKKILDSQCPYAMKIENGNFYWGLQEKDKKEGEGEEEKEKEKKDILDTSEASQAQGEDITLIETEVTQGEFREAKYLRALKDINIEVPRGKVTLVVGDIGSGKSSLLLAMLNEMRAGEGARVAMGGSVAYVAQKPWIMSCSLRDNVTFGLPHDEERFRRAVHFAALEKDLELLAQGELTEIGEKGVNLSGGQKARVSLARALYSQKDIYLLDDVLSAVDIHVGEFLMHRTILSLLRGRTVLMPTHALHFADLADHLIVMHRGRIAVQGPYHLIANTPQFQQLLKQAHQEENKNKDSKEKEEDANVQAQLNMLKEVMDMKSKSLQIERIQKDKLLTANERIVEELMLPEDHEKGQIDFGIFKEYLSLNGGKRFGVIVTFVMFCWVVFNTFASIQMERWCEDPIGKNYDLYVYLGFSIGSNVFIFIRAYALIISGAKQGRIVHKKMIKSLLYASLTNFYNRVPLGRIVNRLNKDLRELDEAIGFAIGGLLVSFFQMLGTLTICLYASTPFILIPIVIITFSCIKLQNYYMKTQREVARFEKSTNSPVVSGFISVINGLGTIRAYEKEQEFTKIQFQKINLNKRVRITRQALETWFSLSLSYLSFVVSLSALGYSIFSSNINSSLAGILMNFALGLSSDIINTALSWAYFETKIVSLERVYNFIHLEPELDYKEYCKIWRTKEQGFRNVIEKGEIEFRGLSSRYRQGLPNVLHRLSFKIKAGEKVGIVGRTGAGKSTIINVLLRLAEISEGDILIDGRDLREYPLKDLRSSMTMIDQEPTLVKSTFRENLDITRQYSDEQLWAVLAECNLAETVREKEGLEGAVSNDSLSAGEKQLLCICRAFLKRSRLVLIDEATASIDLKNDDLIQRVILDKFKESTVITIAHRLSTLRNSDKILVMEQGRVAEWGTPSELENLKGGIYAEMIRKNGSQFLI